MALKVYTTVIRRNNPVCKDPDFLDITVKSGDQNFAPTWDIVMGVKNGTITELEYERRYKNLMDLSCERNPKRWNEILSKERIVLGCFCKPGEFCHRILLAKLLVQFGAAYLGEI